jgi:glutaredoxin
VEQLLPRFRSAHTQVLGVSVDSIFCHANWAASMEGISFPLLADFHPKGKMATDYGLYLSDNGITDRATVVIDASGVVRHSSSVTPAGQRNIEELAALCETIDREHGGGLASFPEPKSIESGAALFVKNRCGASRAVKLARQNLHLESRLTLRNVSDDSAARDELVKIAGKDQAPCLVIDGKPMHENKEIISHLVSGATDIPG